MGKNENLHKAKDAKNDEFYAYMQVYHFSENASCGCISSAIACRFFCRFLYLLFLSPQNRTYFFRMETLRLTCSSAHLEAGSQQSERVRSQLRSILPVWMGNS